MFKFPMHLDDFFSVDSFIIALQLLYKINGKCQSPFLVRSLIKNSSNSPSAIFMNTETNMLNLVNQPTCLFQSLTITYLIIPYLPKILGRNISANSVDPDQTAPRSSLIWVCTICPHLHNFYIVTEL